MLSNFGLHAYLVSKMPSAIVSTVNMLNHGEKDPVDAELHPSCRLDIIPLSFRVLE